MAEVQALLLEKDEKIKELESKLELEDELVYDDRCQWEP